MYRTKDSAIIQDINTNKKYSFGERVDSEYGSYLSISEISWTKNNEFLFEEDSLFKLTQIVSDDLVIQDITELSNDDLNNALIGNGPYVASYSGSLTSPLTIYDLDKKSVACPDLQVGKYYTSQVSETGGSAYVVANPLIPEWLQWPNNREGATNQAERVLEIFDVNSCQSLGGFVIGNGSDVRLNVQMLPN